MARTDCGLRRHLQLRPGTAKGRTAAAAPDLPCTVNIHTRRSHGMHQFEAISIKRTKFLHFNQATGIILEFNIDVSTLSRSRPRSLCLCLFLFLIMRIHLFLLQAVTVAKLGSSFDSSKVSEELE